MRGAEPGDVLKVEILAVETDDFGSTAVFPGFGLLGDLFEEPYPRDLGPARRASRRSGRLEGIRIPADPFVGVIGVAPSHERLEQFRAREAALAEAGGVALPPERAAPRSRPASPTRRRRCARSRRARPAATSTSRRRARARRVFLPVDVAGALLSLGDVHFAQGDGEVCGTAIEMHGRVTTPRRRAAGGAGSATARGRRPSNRSSRSGRAGAGTSSRPGLPIRPDGSNADMDTTLAARNALLAMIDWLGAERGLTREQAYVLCSVAVDLRISEIVDIPNPVVSALCPLDIFHSTPPRRGA